MDAPRAANTRSRHPTRLTAGASAPCGPLRARERGAREWRSGVAPPQEVPLPIPRGVFKIVKEIARHVLRRPVVGVAAAARVPDGRWLLIRRTDTGQWALPGGTLEWGEPLRKGVARELFEEAGVEVIQLGRLLGVYSDPTRDARFHAVTVVVEATVSLPHTSPANAAEIAEVGLFAADALPAEMAHGMGDMLRAALSAEPYWE